MKIIFILVLGFFLVEPLVVVSQTKLPTGIYKLEDTGHYKLNLDGKAYYSNKAPIAMLKEMKIGIVTESRMVKGGYELTIKLDAVATEKLKKATELRFTFDKINYIGIIINGNLVYAARNYVPIETNEISTSSKSKADLERIAEQLKAEQHKLL